MESDGVPRGYLNIYLDDNRHCYLAPMLSIFAAIACLSVAFLLDFGLRAGCMYLWVAAGLLIPFICVIFAFAVRLRNRRTKVLQDLNVLTSKGHSASFITTWYAVYFTSQASEHFPLFIMAFWLLLVT